MPAGNEAVVKTMLNNGLLADLKARAKAGRGKLIFALGAGDDSRAGCRGSSTWSALEIDIHLREWQVDAPV